MHSGHIGIQLGMTFTQQISSDLLREAVDRADDGIYITDRDGTILFANEAIAQITGHSRDKLVGSKTRIFRSDEMSDMYYKRLWDTVLSGEVWRELITNRRADGSLYEAFQTITPVTNSDGKTTMMIAVQRDLSGHSDVREELRRTQTDVERMLQEKETLLREVYHRAKNDLMLAASMLRLQANADSGEDASTRVERAAERTEALSRAYQYFEEHSASARVHAGELVEILAREMCEARAPGMVDLSVRTSAVAISSRLAVAVSIILNELIVNSIKYGLRTNEKLRLSVSVRQNDKNLVLECSDNGPGFPEDVRNRERSGFGLRVIEVLATPRKGTVVIGPPPGATVTVELPLT